MPIMSGKEFEDGIKLGAFHSRGPELNALVQLLKDHDGKWADEKNLEALGRTLIAYLKKKGFSEDQVAGQRDTKGTVTRLRKQVAAELKTAGLMELYLKLTTRDERTTVGGQLADEFSIAFKERFAPPDKDPAWRVQCKKSYNELLMRCEAKNIMTSRVGPLLKCLEPALDNTKSPPSREEVCHEIREAIQRKAAFKKSVKERYGDALEKLETAARKDIFHHELHIGCENELNGTTIVLLKCAEADTAFKGHTVLNNSAVAEISYGYKIAQTKKITELNIAYCQLEVEGAGGSVQSEAHRGKDGLIEHITGPLSPYGNPSLHDNAMAALKILVEMLPDLCDPDDNPGSLSVQRVMGRFFPIATVLEEYNRRLPQGLKDFALYECPYRFGGVDYSWYVAASHYKGISAGTQVNFEVPLAKLADESFVSLLSSKAGLYKECHSEAALFLAGVGVNPKTYVRIHALMSLFCFEAMIMCWENEYTAQTKKKIEAGTAKNQYDLLPKTGVNDLLRVGLSAEEKKLIREKVYPKMKDLEARLIEDHWILLDSLSTLKRPSNLEYYRKWCFEPAGSSRYAKETANCYGNAVKPRCSDSCSRPQGHHGPHGSATRAERAFSGSGKPLPVGMYRVTEGVKSGGSYEPIVVFEARLGTDHFVQLGKHDVSAETRSAQFKRLEAAQKLK
jgi:hypothetical protein